MILIEDNFSMKDAEYNRQRMTTVVQELMDKGPLGDGLQ